MCGKKFDQIWLKNVKKWSTFQTCANCRTKVARHSRTQTETYYTTYTPFDKQQEVHNSRRPYKILVCGSRGGKDRCCVNEFIKKFIDMLGEDHRDELIPRVHGWILAPTYGLANQVWRELQSFMPSGWVEKIDENEKSMFTVDGGIIEVKSTSTPENLVSVGLDIVLWTEAARSKPDDKMREAWSNIFTRLQSPGRGPGGKGGHILINSTPTADLGFYHELYLMALEDKKHWSVHHWRTIDNPYITKEQEEQARRMLTQAQFEMEWLAQFPKEGGEMFANLDEICTLEPEEPYPDKRYYAAWDPASPQGEDDSLVGVRDHLGRQVKILKVSRKLWKHQTEMVADLCKRYNNAPLVILKTAIGEQLPEKMAELGVRVDAIHETNELKGEMVMHFALLCEHKSILLLDEPFQEEQLRQYRSRILPQSGKISYGAPKHKHDDYVSMLLALYKNFLEPSSTIPFIGRLLGAKRRG